MRLDLVSSQDLVELQRLSRELLATLYRAKLHDTILADLLDEFEQQTGKIRYTRVDEDTSSVA